MDEAIEEAKEHYKHKKEAFEVPIQKYTTKINDPATVDVMLEYIEDIYDPQFKSYMAKKAMVVPFDIWKAEADEARNSGTDPGRLFTFLIKQRVEE